MKEDWKYFLEHEAGAVIAGSTVEHFGNPERELSIVSSGDIFTDLSFLGLIAVHGEEAEAFLQNLSCNDVREVTQTRSQLNAFCSAKGRILAGFRLFRCADTYYLELPRTMVAPTLKRLQMYVLRSKVSLMDASDSHVRLGCTGPEMEQRMLTVSPVLPQEVGQVVHQGKLTILRLPGTHPRFEIMGEADEMMKVWEKLAVHAAPVGNALWRLHDIMAGIPVIHPENSEAFVPQTANFREIGALSFTKGCYPGQEVVARSQYLGKLKRRMYLAQVAGGTAPKAGDDLFDAATPEAQAVGRVVDAQPLPDGGHLLLAVILISHAEEGRICLGGEPGPELKFCKLPYALAD